MDTALAVAIVSVCVPATALVMRYVGASRGDLERTRAAVDVELAAQRVELSTCRQAELQLRHDLAGMRAEAARLRDRLDALVLRNVDLAMRRPPPDAG
jgi:hypothetical protein